MICKVQTMSFENYEVENRIASQLNDFHIINKKDLYQLFASEKKNDDVER